MATETLLASWTKLQQALPGEILGVVEQRLGSVWQTASAGTSALAKLATSEATPRQTSPVSASPTAAGTVVVAPTPTPPVPTAEQLTAKLITGLLHHFMAVANQEIEQQLKTLTVNAFDKPDNHLDPLDFNDKVRVSQEGSACLPRYCSSWGLLGEVCFPPFDICASGEASAGLSTLSGLSTALIKSIDIIKLEGAAGDDLIASGRIVLTAHELTAAGFAEAHGGPVGLSIPVGASGSATVINLQIVADIRIEISVDVPTIKKIDLDNLKFVYDSLNVNISGLGPFNFLIGPLIDGLKALITPFFDVNGAIANAVKGTLEDQLNNAVGILDKKLANALG